MISNIGWIVIMFALLILAIIIGTLEDYITYKLRECYDRTLYKCLNCDKRNCKYRMLAARIDKLDREKLSNE